MLAELHIPTRTEFARRVRLACRAVGLLLIGLGLPNIIETTSTVLLSIAEALCGFGLSSGLSIDERFQAWRSVLSTALLIELLASCGPAILSMAAGIYLLFRRPTAQFEQPSSGSVL